MTERFSFDHCFTKSQTFPACMLLLHAKIEVWIQKFNLCVDVGMKSLAKCHISNFKRSKLSRTVLG